MYKFIVTIFFFTISMNILDDFDDFDDFFFLIFDDLMIYLFIYLSIQQQQISGKIV